MSILELFCSVDDFWLQCAPAWQASLLSTGQRHRARATQMHPSEMMTILIWFASRRTTAPSKPTTLNTFRSTYVASFPPW